MDELLHPLTFGADHLLVVFVAAAAVLLTATGLGLATRRDPAKRFAGNAMLAIAGLALVLAL